MEQEKSKKAAKRLKNKFYRDDEGKRFIVLDNNLLRAEYYEVRVLEITTDEKFVKLKNINGYIYWADNTEKEMIREIS